MEKKKLSFCQFTSVLQKKYSNKNKRLNLNLQPVKISNKYLHCGKNYEPESVWKLPLNNFIQTDT